MSASQHYEFLAIDRPLTAARRTAEGFQPRPDHHGESALEASEVIADSTVLDLHTRRDRPEHLVTA